jgi:hypothetical protein
LNDQAIKEKRERERERGRDKTSENENAATKTTMMMTTHTTTGACAAAGVGEAHLGVGGVHDSLRGGADSHGLSHLGLTGASHPSDLSRRKRRDGQRDS